MSQTNSMPHQEPAKKELLYIFRERSIHILVPKKRGEGFLRTPIGHHRSPLSDLSYKIGFDMFGLDAEIFVDTGYVWEDKKPQLVERVLKPISELLGFPYREISHTEFHDLHPIKTEEPTTPAFR